MIYGNGSFDPFQNLEGLDPPTRRDKKSVANSDPGLRGIEIHNIEIVESFRCLAFFVFV